MQTYPHLKIRGGFLDSPDELKQCSRFWSEIFGSNRLKSTKEPTKLRSISYGVSKIPIWFESENGGKYSEILVFQRQTNPLRWRRVSNSKES